MPRRCFAFLLTTYLAFAGGHIYSGDGIVMLRVTEALVTRGETAVRPIEGFESYAVASGRDGRQYAKYGLGLSLAAAPLYAAGIAAEAGVSKEDLSAFDAPKLLYYDRSDPSEVTRTFFASLTNAVIMAATMGLLCLLLLELGLPALAAGIATLVCGLTSVMPFYAKTFFSEPLAGLLLVGTALALRRGWTPPSGAGEPQTPPWFWMTIAGLCLGASTLTRVAHVVLVIPAVAAVLVMAPKRLRSLAASAAGFVTPVLMMMAYNALRFGNPLETGYGDEAGAFGGDVMDGFIGLLGSPGRGLIWYFPWIAFALPGLRAFWQRDRGLTLFSVGSAAVLLLLYSPWHMWEGGWCYGPRFLMPALPLLAVPAALFIYERRTHNPIVLAAMVVGVLSAVMAFHSVQVNYLDYHFAIFSTVPNWESAIRWSWEVAPLVAYWDFPLREFFILPRLLFGTGGALLQVVAWLIVATWLLAATALVRRLVESGRALTTTEAS